MPVKIFDPALRVGWEPDTPVGDTLLRRFVSNQTAWTAAQGEALGARALRRDDILAVDSGRPAGLLNMAIPAAPLYPSGLEETLAALDDFFGLSDGETRGEVSLLSAWPSPDLRPAGWRLGGHPPLMFRPAGGEAPPSPPDLAIEPVREIAQLHEFEAVLIQGFEMEELREAGPGVSLGPALLADERVRMWIGRADGRAVSAASTFIADGINNVTLVATLPDAQRRGYGRALTWQATLAEPSLPAVLFASDAGRPVYERMGYTALFRMFFWWRPRGEQPEQATPEASAAAG